MLLPGEVWQEELGQRGRDLEVGLSHPVWSLLLPDHHVVGGVPLPSEASRSWTVTVSQFFFQVVSDIMFQPKENGCKTDCGARDEGHCHDYRPCGQKPLDLVAKGFWLEEFGNI